MDSSSINQKHSEYLFPCVTNYYSTPLPLKRGEGIREEFCSGMITMGKKLVVLIDSARLLTDDRMKVDSKEKQDGKDRITLGELRVTAL